TIGPITRDVRDAALAMQAMAGPDGRDVFCLPDAVPDYLAGLEQSVKGMRLAWTDDFGYTRKYALPGTEDIITAVRKAANGFTQLGATVEASGEQWQDIHEAVMVTGLLNS